MTITTYKTETRSVKDLVPYASNSRTHSDAQIRQLANSIEEFGFTNPVLIDVDRDNTIVAGHARIQAANLLDIDEVPCVLLTGLSEAQVRTLVIADNKLALNAGWNKELLAVELTSLKEMDADLLLTGFDVDELQSLIGEEEEGAGGDGDGNVVEDHTIVVLCEDQLEQESIYKRLTKMGLHVKAVTNGVTLEPSHG